MSNNDSNEIASSAYYEDWHLISNKICAGLAVFAAVSSIWLMAMLWQRRRKYPFASRHVPLSLGYITAGSVVQIVAQLRTADAMPCNISLIVTVPGLMIAGTLIFASTWYLYWVFRFNIQKHNILAGGFENFANLDEMQKRLKFAKRMYSNKYLALFAGSLIAFLLSIFFISLVVVETDMMSDTSTTSNREVCVTPVLLYNSLLGLLVFGILTAVMITLFRQREIRLIHDSLRLKMEVIVIVSAWALYFLTWLVTSILRQEWINRWVSLLAYLITVWVLFGFLLYKSYNSSSGRYESSANSAREATISELKLTQDEFDTLDFNEKEAEDEKPQTQQLGAIESKLSDAESMIVTYREWTRDNMFVEMLLSKTQRALFMEFLKTEFASENMLFVAAVESYHKIGNYSPTRMSAEFVRLFDTFINADTAIAPVNLPSSITKKLLTIRLSDGGPATVSSFDDALKSILRTLLNDNFFRFRKTVILRHKSVKRLQASLQDSRGSSGRAESERIERKKSNLRKKAIETNFDLSRESLPERPKSNGLEDDDPLPRKCKSSNDIEPIDDEEEKRSKKGGRRRMSLEMEQV